MVTYQGIQRQMHCLKDTNDQGWVLRIKWRLRRNWKYLYDKSRFLEVVKPATFYTELCYHSSSQRLM